MTITRFLQAALLFGAAITLNSSGDAWATPADTLLENALLRGTRSDVIYALEGGADPNWNTPFKFGFGGGYTWTGVEPALALAALRGDLPMMQALHRYGAGIDALNDDGDGILHKLVGYSREFEAYLPKTELFPDLSPAERLPLIEWLLSNNARLDLISKRNRWYQGELKDYDKRLNPLHLGFNPFQLAILWNQEGLVQLFLASGRAPLHELNNGMTPLAAAVSHAEIPLSIPEMLVKAGAQIDVDSGETTALGWAAQAGNIPGVQWLLAHGAQIDGLATSPATAPLVLAAAQNQLQVVQLLLKRGVNLAAYGPIALTQSLVGPLKNLGYERLEVARELLAAGVRMPANAGMAVIETKAKYLSDAFEFALANGADANEISAGADTQSLLAFAIRRKDDSLSLVKSCLKHGANPNKVIMAKPHEKLTVLSYTIQANTDDVWYKWNKVDELLWAGASPDLPLPGAAVVAAFVHADYQSSYYPPIPVGTVNLLMSKTSAKNVEVSNGRTALQIMVRAKNPVIANALIASGLDVNHVDSDGRTALLEAAATRQIDIVRALLAVPGLDVNLASPGGYTALIEAVTTNQIDIVRALLAVPALKVNLQTHSGETALSMSDTAELSLLLLQAGANTELGGSAGTPLIRAVARKRLDQVKVLVSHGANVNAVDARGQDAVGLAQKANDVPMLIYLCQHGSTNAYCRP